MKSKRDARRMEKKYAKLAREIKRFLKKDDSPIDKEWKVRGT